MKILIIITKASIGGAQISVLNLAREMAALGHEVTVGSGKGDFLYQELTANNIPFVKFANLKRSHNPFDIRRFTKELKDYLDARQFDVVHFNSSNALPGAKAAKESKYKPKTVFTFRGMSLMDKNYAKKKILKKAYLAFFKHYLGFIDEPVFVSKENEKSAKENGSLGRGTVIYNGISQDLKFYDKNKARKLLAAHLQAGLEDRFVVGSIGRICYAKNYNFFVNVFPEILKIEPRAIGLIIGPGDQSRLKKLAAKKGLEQKIFFTGGINNASRYLKVFDLLALTSIYEGMPIVVIEAMMAGRPILASEVGGVSELLGRDGRQLYESRSQNGFLNKFLDLSQDKKIRAEVRRYNLERAPLFDIKKTAEGYLALYSK